MRKLLSLLIGIYLIALVSAQDVFGDVAGQLYGRIFSGILWIGIAFIIIGASGSVMYYFFIYKRKFDIEVKIFSERASEKESIIFDKAAILFHRSTGTKYFKLWNSKAELPTPPFNILQKTNRGDYLELRRTSEDKWYFLYPPKINKMWLMKSDGKVYPLAQQKTLMIDMDTDFWSQKRKSMNKGMFDPEKIWMKMLPYVPYILGGFFIIFILYILMSYLPEILAQLQQLASEINRQSTAQITTG